MWPSVIFPVDYPGAPISLIPGAFTGNSFTELIE